MTYNEAFSLLISQVGYHNGDTKKAFIRSAHNEPAGLPDSFAVKRSDETVYEGPIRYWGEKWGSYWWTMDFSAVNVDGRYSLCVTHDVQSAGFDIRGDVLTNSRLSSDDQCDLVDIALHQLDLRLKKTSDKDAVPIDGYVGKYIPGYRDCGTEIRELSSHVVSLHGLLDMYENKDMYKGLSVEQQQKLISQVKWLADYIVFSQEHSEDPLYNGRFNHDGGWQTNYGTTNYHNWHDTAYALTSLARTCILMKDETDCAEYLASARLAYDNCVYRPYNLDSDIGSRTDQNGVNTFNDDFTEEVNTLARQVYNKPENWNIPSSLKTKDKLTFLWGCMLLHEATGEDKYLDMAVDYARSAIGRQFTDWENHIDGVYGNFYAFEGDNETFSLEWNQNHKFHMGNIEPTNLRGIMDLYRLLPDHADAAKWYNAVKTYGEAYLKNSSRLSPLGIYPLTVYSDKQYGGVKYFQVTNHGAVGMYGQVAKNMLEVAHFLGDKEYAELAANNLQFVAGLNPGIPTAYDETAWQPKSMIIGLGADFFYAQHALTSAPKGSGINGFSADVQFQPTKLGTVPDAPKGILFPDGKYQFNEDYLPHSHGYVSGVALTERPFELTVVTKLGEEVVKADVSVAYDDNEVRLNEASMTLPVMKHVTVTAWYDGIKLSECFDTMGGGKKALAFDFMTAMGIEIQAPHVLNGSNGKATVTIKNLTGNNNCGQLSLSADGVRLAQTSFVVELASGGEQVITVEMAAEDRVTPYTIIATVNINGDIYRSFVHGKVSSGAIV